jgi:translocation and assembly module TamB
MTQETRRRKWRWLRHTVWVLGAKLLLIFLVLLGVGIFFGSGAGNPIIHRFIVRRLERMTGGRVELRTVSIHWLSLEFRLKGLVIHGREPASTEPLFAADEVVAGLRIDSFWGRRVSLQELLIQKPRVHVRVEKNGSSNVPPPRNVAAPQKSPRELLFDLHIRRLQLDDGWVLYNDVRKPLALEGSDLHLVLDGTGTTDHPMYIGALDWQSVTFTENRFLPIPVGVSAKFSLRPDGFTLEQAVVTAAHSHLDAQIEMENFAQPKWSFRYRGWINLRDVREIFRSPETPTGRADVRGEGSFAGGTFRSSGAYSAEDITLTYPIFRAAGLASRGSINMNNQGLDVPDFVALAFGGSVKGRVQMEFKGLKFRALTHLQGLRLAGALPALERPNFPVDELHWDSLISGDTVETWTGPFAHFEVAGNMQWTAPQTLAPRHIPVNGAWAFRYRYDPQILDVKSGQFDTPASRATVSGILAATNTALDVHVDAASIEIYKDFINAIRGSDSKSLDAIRVLSGNAKWDGKMTGPAGRPTFSGHVRGQGVRFEEFGFDSVEGELTYSADRLNLTRARVRRGEMNVGMELSLDLDEWSFQPDNTWSADVSLDKAPLDTIQRIFGSSYPARGLVSGDFRGHGTRREPELTGLFDLAEGNAYDVTFDRLRGQLSVNRHETRISNAELRLFAPGKEPGRGPGIVTGTAAYNLTDHTASVDLVGASLPLGNFEKLQSTRFPMDGQVSFRIKANGPLLSPQGEGNFRVVDLRIGQAVIGSFDGKLSSDGRAAGLELSSAMTAGEIAGGYTLGLSAPYPIDGKVAIKNIDLDPFLVAALHLEGFDLHGKADGEIGLNGTLKNPESLVVDAQFSRLLFDYANVQLENVGAVHFRSSRDALQIEPAELRGRDTDVHFGGHVNFSGQRGMNLSLDGGLDLRLLSGLAPGLTARGPAQVDATFAGSLDHPLINGHIHIDDASMRVSDFPTGLSAVKGDLTFNDTRLLFNDLTAQAGGGTLHVSGSVNYAERPLRYDITAKSDGTRIRYPEGMSWLTGGTLRLTGTSQGAVLSGRVTVQRVTLTQGLEVAGVLASSKEGISGPSTNSAFLRNLQFDVEAVSTPDARMEWPGAELDAEADIRVRGTWEHPILLGHIHILSGELLFHGNRYTVSRGEINFANPFRIDPEINVEAATIIQQYEISLNFTGQASKLSLAYRSDPPLPANDIITLLALGQTSSESTVRSAGVTQSGTTTGATALLSEAISSQLGGRLEKLFGITNFRVDPGLTAVGSTGLSQNAAARVTVQQRVTRNLTVTYVSNVGSTQQQVIQVEYNVNRNVSIVGLRDYNGTFGIDVVIKKRFP